MSNVKEVRFETVSRPTKNEPGVQRVSMFWVATKDRAEYTEQLGIIVRDRGVQNYKASFLNTESVLVAVEQFFSTRSAAGHAIARAYYGAQDEKLAAEQLVKDTEALVTVAAGNVQASPSTLDGKGMADGILETLTAPLSDAQVDAVIEAAVVDEAPEGVAHFGSLDDAAAVLGISKDAARKRAGRGTILIG